MRRSCIIGALAAFLGLSGRVHAQNAAVLVEDYRFGSFIAASNIEIDPFGAVYVTDAGAHSLVKFGADGAPLGIAGGRGWALSEFDHPCGIDARLGIVLYVADRENHRVVRLDKDIHALGAFSTKDKPGAENSFGLPRDVVMTSMGELLVLDGENRRIVSTSGFAAVERSFGGVESGEGRLQNPIAMARFDDDRLVVLESNRISFFDAFGNYIFSGAYNTFEDAKGIACSKDRVAVVGSNTLHLFKTDGTLEHTISRERIVFAGETGAFQDVALGGGRIFILTANSVVVFTLSQ
ncbi:MAG: NHL repeat-containing protein [Ignavibacteriae bacterium]|nr:NHL repeat-containing protein [Ignavibacteriota bacterium]